MDVRRLEKDDDFYYNLAALVYNTRAAYIPMDKDQAKRSLITTRTKEERRTEKKRKGIKDKAIL